MEQPLKFKQRRGPFKLEKHRREAKRVRDRKRRERLRAAKAPPAPPQEPPQPPQPAPELTEEERLAKITQPSVYAEPKLREDP